MKTVRKSEAQSIPVLRIQNGFSLIELLIVVAIILIIAAIAIPNLIKARISANEASAVSSMRTYTSANVAYSTLCPLIGFPATLADLGPGGGACAGGANIVDPILGSAAPVKAGYGFTYTPVAVSGTNTNYTMNGTPIIVGATGQRNFFCDETGLIRYNATGVATVASPPL
jgi:type IV pilus assembly protein PilA